MTFIEPFGVVQMCHLVMLACQHRTKEDFPLMLSGQRASMTFILPSCGHLLLVYSMVFCNSTVWLLFGLLFILYDSFPVCSEAFYLEAILNSQKFISTQSKILSSSTL